MVVCCTDWVRAPVESSENPGLGVGALLDAAVHIVLDQARSGRSALGVVVSHVCDIDWDAQQCQGKDQETNAETYR